MTSTTFYLAGSLVLLVGGVLTNGPAFLVVSSLLFVVGSLLALVRELEYRK